MDPAAAHDAAAEDEFLKDARIAGVRTCNALTNQEASLLLARYREAHTRADPAFCPPPMVGKTAAYLDTVLAGGGAGGGGGAAAGRNEEAAEAVRARLLDAGLDDAEMALLANLLPETPDEAYALVPSLKRRKELSAAALGELLEALHSYRTYH